MLSLQQRHTGGGYHQPSKRISTVLGRLAGYHWEIFTACREKTNFERGNNNTLGLRPNYFVPP